MNEVLCSRGHPVLARESVAVSILLILVALPLMFAACDGDNHDHATPHTGSIEGVATYDCVPEYPFCTVDETRVEELLGRMTLRQKIAQMYVVGAQVYPWFDIGDARRFVEEIGVGGVGIQPLTGIGLSPVWTVANTNKLQSWALASESSIPLFIACDQEGGIPSTVNTMTGGTDQPGAIGMGATFDTALTHASYGIMGEQLSALGINNALGPVVELAVTYEEVPMYMRCFGEDAARVSRHARQSVRGIQENLVVATAKHFPGQGTASGDDHAGAIFNYENEQDVRDRYFPPFESAIAAGVDMIMTNHVVYTAWEDKLPTTFSHKITTDILRGELGYEGLIVTDDMNMGAIMTEPLQQHPDVMAIAAGADLVLDGAGDTEPSYGMHPDNLVWAWDVEGQIDAVAQAVADGVISVDRIDESVRRILRTKMKYCLFERPLRDPAEAAAAMNTPSQIDASKQLHERSFTLLKNDDALWPLERDAGLKLHVVSVGRYQSEMYPDAFWGNISSTSLRLEIQKLYPQATGSHFGVDPDEQAVSRLVADTAAAMPGVLVIGTFNGYHYPRQRELVNSLLSLGIPTILVAEATPYDLMAFPDVDAYLAVYSNRELAMEVAAETLFGLRQPTGRLPVTLSEQYPAGYSAYP